MKYARETCTIDVSFLTQLLVFRFVVPMRPRPSLVCLVSLLKCLNCTGQLYFVCVCKIGCTHSQEPTYIVATLYFHLIFHPKPLQLYCSVPARAPLALVTKNFLASRLISSLSKMLFVKNKSSARGYLFRSLSPSLSVYMRLQYTVSCHVQRNKSNNITHHHPSRSYCKLGLLTTTTCQANMG